jgi:hypothetical protein
LGRERMERCYLTDRMGRIANSHDQWRRAQAAPSTATGTATRFERPRTPVDGGDGNTAVTCANGTPVYGSERDAAV